MQNPIRKLGLATYAGRGCYRENYGQGKIARAGPSPTQHHIPIKMINTPGTSDIGHVPYMTCSDNARFKQYTSIYARF